jgi:hypothetical protein
VNTCLDIFQWYPSIPLLRTLIVGICNLSYTRTRINNYLDELERSLELEIKVNHDKMVERIERGKYNIKSTNSGLKAES